MHQRMYQPDIQRPFPLRDFFSIFSRRRRLIYQTQRRSALTSSNTSNTQLNSKKRMRRNGISREFTAHQKVAGGEVTQELRDQARARPRFPVPKTKLAKNSTHETPRMPKEKLHRTKILETNKHTPSSPLATQK